MLRLHNIIKIKMKQGNKKTRIASSVSFTSPINYERSESRTDSLNKDLMPSERLSFKIKADDIVN